MLYQLSYSRSLSVVTNTPLGGISYSAAMKFVVVGGGFEPPKANADRFTVCSLWPLGNPTIVFGAGDGT
ncbi:protein of unknown function [Pseudodesulfovibrio piezophilus C1TLV30]|uniref:Uncharacterized protein n=1 Tax=Pseudodesulfovibrio piezophilus (strain DSM 21447 / JCM 15486 / C1TLV30) TaxID=1322246 RepID=M1WNQ8_PSEP2|nr:protein of unknown function [Pseudodesulfovibrio piezophilus C1TLV30]